MRLPLTFPLGKHAATVPDNLPMTPAQAALAAIGAELLATASTGDDPMGPLLAAALPAIAHGFQSKVRTMADEEIARMARTIRDGADRILALAENTVGQAEDTLV